MKKGLKRDQMIIILSFVFCLAMIAVCLITGMALLATLFIVPIIGCLIAQVYLTALKKRG